MTLIEKLRRAHLVLATTEGDEDRRSRLATFFPSLDPDQACRALDEAARSWDTDRLRSEQIYVGLINQDKETRT